MLTFTPATPLKNSSICFGNEISLHGAAGVKVSIEASQALDRGSIPRRRSVFLKISPTGNRTRVSRVRTWYPSHLDYWGNPSNSNADSQFSKS